MVDTMMRYGAVNKGQYKLLATGFACSLLRVCGRPVWVPDYVFSPDPAERFNEKPDDKEQSND